MVTKTRAQRIAERVREELSEMLLEEVSDPRLAGIFITDVKIDRELAFADIYISALEGSERSRQILEGMQHAQGYLRSELAHRMELRVFPHLRFHWDPTYERADRIEKLFAALHEEEAASPRQMEDLDPKGEEEDGDVDG